MSEAKNRRTPCPREEGQSMTTLLQRLQELFWGEKAAGSNGTAPALRVTVKCGQCGEIIATRIEKAYELQEESLAVEDAESDEAPSVAGYLLTKELLGSDCPNLIHLTMRFDADKELIEHSVDGGELVGVKDSD